MHAHTGIHACIHASVHTIYNVRVDVLIHPKLQSVCVRRCMYVYIYIYIYIYMCVCVCMCVYIYIYIYRTHQLKTETRLQNMYAYLNMRSRRERNKEQETCTDVHVYIYLYKYIYIYIYIYMHTHIFGCVYREHVQTDTSEYVFNDAVTTPRDRARVQSLSMARVPRCKMEAKLQPIRALMIGIGFWGYCTLLRV